VGNGGQVSFVTPEETIANPYFAAKDKERLIGAAVIPMKGKTKALDTLNGTNLLVIGFLI